MGLKDLLMGGSPAKRIQAAYEAECQRRLDLAVGQHRRAGTPCVLTAGQLWQIHTSALQKAWHHVKQPVGTLDPDFEMRLFEEFCDHVPAPRDVILRWREADVVQRKVLEDSRSERESQDIDVLRTVRQRMLDSVTRRDELDVEVARFD